MWFQESKTTNHTARATMELLCQISIGRIISWGTEINWLSHSPDLTALIFLLWGYLKKTVYVNKP